MAFIELNNLNCTNKYKGLIDLSFVKSVFVLVTDSISQVESWKNYVDDTASAFRLCISYKDNSYEYYFFKSETDLKDTYTKIKAALDSYK